MASWEDEADDREVLETLFKARLIDIIIILMRKSESNVKKVYDYIEYEPVFEMYEK